MYRHQQIQLLLIRVMKMPVSIIMTQHIPRSLCLKGY